MKYDSSLLARMPDMPASEQKYSEWAGMAPRMLVHSPSLDYTVMSIV